MKVSVPLHGCEHFYLLTKPLQEQLPPSTPGLTQRTHRKMNYFLLQAQLLMDIKFQSLFTVSPAEYDVSNKEVPPHVGKLADRVTYCTVYYCNRHLLACPLVLSSKMKFLVDTQSHKVKSAL